MEHLREFDGKPLLAAEKAELDVTAEPAADHVAADAAEALAKWLKEKLGERVEAMPGLQTTGFQPGGGA